MIDLYSIAMTPLLRAFFTLLGTTTGVWIRFEKIHGKFFDYKASLDGVSLEINKHLRCEVETCSLEFSLLDFSLETLVVSNVSLEGARIEYDHLEDRDLIPRTLPPFVIKHLRIKDGAVVFNDHSHGKAASITLALEEYHCEALHSQSLLFDAIFSAHAMGQLADAPFSMTYKEDGAKCISQWSISDLATQAISPFVQGKLDLIKQSALNLMVSHEWLRDDDELTMTVQVLVLDLVNLEWPALMPPGSKIFADALSTLLNHQIKEIPIAFQFKARKDDFMKLKDIDTAGILTAFADALTQAIMDKSLQNYDRLWDMGLMGLDTLIDIKNLFDKY